MHSILNLAGACYDQGRICPEGIVGNLEMNMHLVLDWRGDIISDEFNIQIQERRRGRGREGGGTDSILRVAVMFKQQQFK